MLLYVHLQITKSNISAVYRTVPPSSPANFLPPYLFIPLQNTGSYTPTFHLL
jgi:hypothetical protein